MSKKKWKFNEWFEAQFGKEPNSQTRLSELYEEEDHIKRNLASIQELIRRRERMVNYRNAAYYAWNLKDGDKK